MSEMHGLFRKICYFIFVMLLFIGLSDFVETMDSTKQKNIANLKNKLRFFLENFRIDANVEKEDTNSSNSGKKMILTFEGKFVTFKTNISEYDVMAIPNGKTFEFETYIVHSKTGLSSFTNDTMALAYRELQKTKKRLLQVEIPNLLVTMSIDRIQNYEICFDNGNRLKYDENAELLKYTLMDYFDFYIVRKEDGEILAKSSGLNLLNGNLECSIIRTLHAKFNLIVEQSDSSDEIFISRAYHVLFYKKFMILKFPAKYTAITFDGPKKYPVFSLPTATEFDGTTWMLYIMMHPNDNYRGKAFLKQLSEKMKTVHDEFEREDEFTLLQVHFPPFCKFLKSPFNLRKVFVCISESNVFLNKNPTEWGFEIQEVQNVFVEESFSIMLVDKNNGTRIYHGFIDLISTSAAGFYPNIQTKLHNIDSVEQLEKDVETFLSYSNSPPDDTQFSKDRLMYAGLPGYFILKQISLWDGPQVNRSFEIKAEKKLLYQWPIIKEYLGHFGISNFNVFYRGKVVSTLNFNFKHALMSSETKTFTVAEEFLRYINAESHTHFTRNSVHLIDSQGTLFNFFTFKSKWPIAFERNGAPAPFFNRGAKKMIMTTYMTRQGEEKYILRAHYTAFKVPFGPFTNDGEAFNRLGDLTMVVIIPAEHRVFELNQTVFSKIATDLENVAPKRVKIHLPAFYLTYNLTYNLTYTDTQKVRENLTDVVELISKISYKNVIDVCVDQFAAVKESAEIEKIKIKNTVPFFKPPLGGPTINVNKPFYIALLKEGSKTPFFMGSIKTVFPNMQDCSDVEK